MAIRSTNANRYNPKASAQGGVSRGDRVNFGPSKNPGYNERDSDEQKWGMSPWYGRDGNPMPWSGPPGQERGQRAPVYTPNAGDPRNAGYFKNQSTPEEIAADNAAAKQRYGAQQELLSGNDAYMAAKNAGDLRGQIAAMTALKQQMQQQRFVDQGGTAQTWQDRYKNEDNWMRPGVGGAVPAPQPRPAGVGPTGAPPASTQALPPSQNPMFQGYQGQGIVQGPGGFGGAGGGQSMIGTVGPNSPLGQWLAMQSKSGMGQSPMSGPMMSTGNPMGGMMGGGLPPQLLQMLFSGGMGGMGQGGLGGWAGFGYNPTASPLNMGMYNGLFGGY